MCLESQSALRAILGERERKKGQPSLAVDRRIAGLAARNGLALHVKRGSDRSLGAPALAFAFVLSGVHSAQSSKLASTWAEKSAVVMDHQL